MARLVLTVLVTILLGRSLVAVAEENGPYLFEQLEKNTYQQTFNALFQGQAHLEPWLQGYLDHRNGVDIPVTELVIQGQPYELYQICQPHNCPGNVLYVLFVPGGSRAYARFTKDDGSNRYFGHPDQEIQQVLKSLPQ